MRLNTGISAAAVLIAALPAAVSAQSYTPPKAEVRAAMEKMAWLDGTWEGEGWSLTRSGERETYSVREEAALKLGGVIIAVEGRGWRIDENGEEIEGHHAFAVLSYDSFAKAYRIYAFTRDGYQTTSTPEVGENSYIWTVPAGPGAEIRYHARLSEDGEWVESGERCMGDKCVQTMEMRLRKTNAE